MYNFVQVKLIWSKVDLPFKTLKSHRPSAYVILFTHAGALIKILTVYGSLYVSGKLPTYSSPKPTFCPKWEVRVNVSLGRGGEADRHARYVIKLVIICFCLWQFVMMISKLRKVFWARGRRAGRARKQLFLARGLAPTFSSPSLSNAG